METSLVIAIREVLEDLAESATDVVPPIKFAADATKLLLSLPDRIFAHKIHLFLKGIDTQAMRKFTDKIQGNESLRRKVAENIILTLDKIDDLEKADMIAKVFCAYVEDKIELETFRRLTRSINAAFVEDLKKVITAFPSALQPYLGNLISAGLAEIPNPPRRPILTSQAPEPLTATQLNLLGKIFQQIMRDEPFTGLP